ncbi:MAG: hypothetical protein WA885_21070 [Phormidesmis sp.]
MSNATKTLCNRVAIAFDFDDTLVPDTFDLLIKDLGHDPQTFRTERYEPMKQSGWDGIPARFYALSEAAKAQSNPDKRFTQKYLQQFGQQLQPFPGVIEMFDRLRQSAHAIDPEIEVEFYLITSGFIEIARHSSIADCFKAMWGCEFHYNDKGEAICLKRILSHPEKTRYLYYISKGIDHHSEDNLLFVYQDVPEDELHVPLSQIIYTGDGTSDLPCFHLLNQEKGTALGVYPEGSAEDWASEYEVSASQRIANLAPADYSEGSELMRSLILAVESVCKKIQLRQLSVNE